MNYGYGKTLVVLEIERVTDAGRLEELVSSRVILLEMQYVEPAATIREHGEKVGIYVRNAYVLLYGLLILTDFDLYQPTIFDFRGSEKTRSM